MRVLPISLSSHININKNNNKEVNKTTHCINPQIKTLSHIYYIPFTSIANSGKLRTLFHYGLPCMYSGIEMIDPKSVTRMLKNGTFQKPVSRVIEVLTPYEKSITGIEAKVFDIIKETAQSSPDKNLHELMQEIAPRFKKRLRKKQIPVFQELTEASHEYRYKFKQFMEDTNKKLNNEPIVVPFSSYEFKYKLDKIKEDIEKGENIKAIKVMNKLQKEANKFTNSTTANTIDRQKNTLSFMYKILKHSVLKENTALNNLFNTSKSRLNKERIVIPFNRKSFIYDLSKLIKDIPDQQLLEKMISIAQKLPTSKQSTSAYILKSLTASSDKIGYRLLWPSIASVEHIYPKSCGGPDLMYNFGGACCRENTERQNIDFMKQLKRCPQTKENCQKYIDKLIELANSGVFAKHNINVKYILDFKNTIYRQSRKTLNLDISKLKPELLNINNCKKNA